MWPTRDLQAISRAVMGSSDPMVDPPLAVMKDGVSKLDEAVKEKSIQIEELKTARAQDYVKMQEEVMETMVNTHEEMKGDLQQLQKQMSIRMANLAIVCSHTANGVSKVHSELLKAKLFKDLYELWP
ncbi:PREDICTED: glycogen/starch/alpha-glucan [Prunus dulcis]|uniref:Alpha-1,4 glucan phosphorylase n=1 Tax=Prunus dulcis TaxID=3755 RepID=A0A5E4E5F4_PRUDU|nr:PREDICTED: glycogen/starch/alpha-glucan [Prunus dulcis]